MAAAKQAALGTGAVSSLSDGRLASLVLSGALVPPRVVLVEYVLDTVPPLPDEVSSEFESDTWQAFGQTFRVWSIGRRDRRMSRVLPDGAEVDLGTLREFFGWRPGGPPVGGWK